MGCRKSTAQARPADARSTAAVMSSNSFESLDERRYLREKVVVTYEALWRGETLDEKAWDELLFLKVNASWIQTAVASLSGAQLRAQQPILRRLFDECCARLDEAVEPSATSHALETLGGIFLGLGCRSFHDFGAEVVELLSGLDRADAVFGAMLSHLRRLMERGSKGAEASALRRAAIRLLLCLTAAAANLNQNILVEFVTLHGLAPTLATAIADGDAATQEDAAQLVLLLASYQRHEAPNDFLRLIHATAAASGEPSELLRALLDVARRTFGRVMYPAADATGGACMPVRRVRPCDLTAVCWCVGRARRARR